MMIEVANDTVGKEGWMCQKVEGKAIDKIES